MTGALVTTGSASETITVRATNSAGQYTDASCAVTVGGMTHGSLFTVSGSGFGTRPNYNYGSYTWKGFSHLHYYWCDFSQGEPAAYTQAGWAAVLSGAHQWWYNPQGVHEAVPAIGSNSNLSGRYQAGPSASGWCWRRYGNPAAGGSRYGGLYMPMGGAGFQAGNYTGEYLAYKYRLSSSPGSAMGNLKNFRRTFAWDLVSEVMSSQSGDPVATELSIGANGWYPPVSSYTNGGLYSASGDGEFSVTSWGKVEQLVKAPSGGNSGTWAMRLNGTWIRWSNSSTRPTTFVDVAVISSTQTTFGDANYTPGGNNNYALTLGSESHCDATYSQDFTDIYFDLTQARVEIVQGAITEAQLVNSWSNTSITIIFNRGQLSAGAATLQVIGADGNVIGSPQAVTVA